MIGNQRAKESHIHMNTKISMMDMRSLIESHIPEINELSLDEKAGLMRNIEDLRSYSITSDKDTKEIASLEIYHKETHQDRENALVISLSCSIVEPDVKILCGKRQYAFEMNLIMKRQTAKEYKDERYVASPLSRDEVSKIIFGYIVPV
jgi:hypothetical protein